MAFEAFSGWADGWLGFVAAALRGSAMLFALALLVWLPLRRRLPAQFVYVLFLLVLLRLAMPWDLELPGWLAAFSPQYLLENAWQYWIAPPPPPATAVLLPMVAREAVTAGEAAPSVPWETWVFGVWASVVGWLALRFAVRPAPDPGPRAPCAGARPPRVAAVSGAVAQAGGLAAGGSVLGDPRGRGARGGGLLRSYVLLPEGLMDELTVEQRRFVLLHELAHIRRGDLWVSLFQRLVGMAFFFHPLVWWANRIIDEQREFACDDAALACCGGRKVCGQGFLSVVEWSHGRACAPAGALGMFHSDNVIRRRLMRILDGNRKVGGRRSATVCTVMVLALGVVAVPAVKAQNPKSERELEMAILQAKLDKLEAESRIVRLELQKLQQKEKPAIATGRQVIDYYWDATEMKPKGAPEPEEYRRARVHQGADGDYVILYSKSKPSGEKASLRLPEGVITYGRLDEVSGEVLEECERDAGKAVDPRYTMLHPESTVVVDVPRGAWFWMRKATRSKGLGC